MAGVSDTEASTDSLPSVSADDLNTSDEETWWVESFLLVIILTVLTLGVAECFSALGNVLTFTVPFFQINLWENVLTMPPP